MTGEWVAIPWLVLGPLAAGWAVLRALGIRASDDILAWAGWIAVLGPAAVGALVFAARCADVSQAWWWAAPVVVVAGTLPWCRRQAGPAAGGGRLRTGPLLAVVLAVAVCAGLFQTVSGWAVPAIVADEGNIWTAAGKTLYLAGDMESDYARRLGLVAHADYPKLNPALHAWAYAVSGGIVHFANRLPIPLFHVGLVLVAAAALRRQVRDRVAALLLLALVADPVLHNYWRLSLADLVVAAGLLVAVDGWSRYRRDGGQQWLSLCGLGWAVALAAKHEAKLFAMAAVLGWLVAGRGAGRRIGSVAGWVRLSAWPIAVIVAHGVFNRHYGLRNDLWGNNPTGKSMPVLWVEQFVDRAPAILEHLVLRLCDPGFRQGMVLAVLVAMVFLRREAWRPQLRGLTVALLVAVAGMHAVYLGSWIELQRHLDTSYERVTFQLAPFLLLWLAGFARAAVPRWAA